MDIVLRHILTLNDDVKSVIREFYYDPTGYTYIEYIAMEKAKNALKLSRYRYELELRIWKQCNLSIWWMKAMATRRSGYYRNDAHELRCIANECHKNCISDERFLSLLTLIRG